MATRVGGSLSIFGDQSMGLTPEQRRSCVPYKEEQKRENK